MLHRVVGALQRQSSSAQFHPVRCAINQRVRPGYPWTVIRDADQPDCTYGLGAREADGLPAGSLRSLVPPKHNAGILLLAIRSIAIPVVSGIIEVGVCGD